MAIYQSSEPCRPRLEVAMKPLFIPLKTEYFEAFKSGKKTIERRLYGKRWNSNTCKPGRNVVLSKGYGKADRLSGYIVEWEMMSTQHPLFPESAKAAMEAIYGPSRHDIIAITIKLEPHQ